MIVIRHLVQEIDMRPLLLLTLIVLSYLYGHAYADAGKEALINSYLGEYSLITECDLFYYGIGRPRDFAKARECYRYDPIMDLLLYANGHGVKQDVARAKNLAGDLEHFMKEDILRDLQKLESATEKYELDPCDYAYSTPGLSYCARLSKLREAVRLYELNAVYRDHKNARIRKYWVKLDAAIKDFADAEWSYVYDSLEGGSMQRHVPGEAVATIYRKHRELLEQLANYAPYQNIAAENFPKTDQALNEKYKQVLEQQEDKQLRKKLIQAQRKWIVYRDAMVALFQAIDDSRHPADKVALDAMILLTQQRIDTL